MLKLTSFFQLQYIIPLSIFMCASTCSRDCGGEGFTPQYQVENNTIIQIENNTSTFNLGATIYIITVVENNQTTTDNQQITISDFHNYNTLDYNIALYKETNYDNLSKITINQENIEIISGDVTVNSNPNITVSNQLSGTSFSSKFGIKLLETGTFYLGNSYLEGNNGTITIYSGNVDGDLTLVTSIINSDNNDLYKFTVN